MIGANHFFVNESGFRIAGAIRPRDGPHVRNQ